MDNDSACREVIKKIKPEHYKNIIVKCILLNNFNGDANLSLDGNSTNNEIEDFVYPEIICFLVNKLLTMKSLQAIKEKEIVSRILKPAFKASGILSLLENEKNNKNPDCGQELKLENVKTSLANMFKIELNARIIKILYECIEKYPYVEKAIREIYKFD